MNPAPALQMLLALQILLAVKSQMNAVAAADAAKTSSYICHFDPNPR